MLQFSRNSTHLLDVQFCASVDLIHHSVRRIKVCTYLSFNKVAWFASKFSNISWTNVNRIVYRFEIRSSNIVTFALSPTFRKVKCTVYGCKYSFWDTIRRIFRCVSIIKTSSIHSGISRREEEIEWSRGYSLIYWL